MIDLAAVALVMIVILIGAVLPGPSLLIVSQSALRGSAEQGRRVALGVAVGSLLFATAAVMGLGAALLASEMLSAILRLTGGTVLIVLAIRTWRSVGRHLAEAVVVRPSRALFAGLLTQLGNPKAIVGYATVFAAMVPSAAGIGTLVALPVASAGMELFWYATVATCLARPRPARLYSRASLMIDRTAAVLLVMIGAVALLEAGTTLLRL